jgi:hypothetical protein
MQKILIIFALLLMAAGNAAAQSQPRNIIKVIDARNFKEPTINWKNPDDVATYKADLARHTHHEVNVYHYSSSQFGSYKVTYYQNENDSIKAHGFCPSTNEDFDQAEYTWNKDTLNIHLFSANKTDKTYKAFGWGSTSSLVLDK